MATTGKPLLWSFLSRGVSPYVRESLFIDSVAGITPWVKLASDGKFNADALERYSQWADGIAGQASGKPGPGAKHNLIAFGRDFLTKMSQPEPDGRTKLRKLHDLIANFDNSGPMIRREFLRIGESAGIDKKVISFTRLVSGRKDVMVLDRVQIKGLWDDGRFAERNLYDGWEAEPADKSVISGSKLSDLFFGARSVLAHWWRLWASVITKAQVRRGLPSGCIRIGPLPKSTCAASPGAKLRRTVTSGGCSPRNCRSMRTTAE